MVVETSTRSWAMVVELLDVGVVLVVGRSVVQGVELLTRHPWGAIGGRRERDGRRLDGPRLTREFPGQVRGHFGEHVPAELRDVGLCGLRGFLGRLHRGIVWVRETGSESRPSPAPSVPQPRARPPTTDRPGRLHFPIPVTRPRRPRAQLRLLRPGEPVPSDSSYLELARPAEWPGRPRQPPPCSTSTLPVPGCCCARAPVRFLFRPGSPPGPRPLGSGFRVPRGLLLSQLFPCRPSPLEPFALQTTSASSYKGCGLGHTRC